jgi:hypothetical protein
VLGADLAMHFPDKIDQQGILRNLLVAAPVPQNVVDLLHRFGIVTPVALVGDGEVFFGVDVMQRDGARVAVSDRMLQIAASENQSGGGKAKAISGARCEQRRQNSARVTTRHVLLSR